MTKTIDYTEDILDSRDLIKRLEELEGMEARDEDEERELAFLRAAAEEVNEWDDGAALIAEDYFTDYCEELCKDIGDLPREIPWYIEIDWEKTAGHIKQDYSEIELDGRTYYYRA